MESIAMSCRLMLPIMAVAMLLTSATAASALPWWEKEAPWNFRLFPSAALHPPADTVPLGRPCSTQDCVVVRELLERVDVIQKALRVPTMGETRTIYPAWLTRELSGPYVRRELRREVFAFPQRFPAWCARMRQFAASYTGPDDARTDYMFMSDLLALAELIDRHGKGGCLSGMLTAFPVIDPDLVEDAEYLCLGRQWRSASCSRLKLPARALSPPGAQHP